MPMQKRFQRIVVAVAIIVVALAVAVLFVYQPFSEREDAMLAVKKTADGTKTGTKTGADRRQRRGRRRGGRTHRVAVAKVEMKTVGNRVAAVGTGRAFRSLTLSADVSGVVEAVKFVAGQKVEAGDPLVVLESDAQRIAVKLAQVNVKEAAAAVKRYETLESRNAASSVQLEQARTKLAQAQAELEAKQYELKRRTITAPFAGVLGITNLTKGDYVKEGTAIATIDDTSRLIVEFVVAETFASSIKLGQKVRALTPAILGVVFRGTVSAKDSRIDVASRTLRVEATLPNADNRLIPGMTFSVSITIEGDKLPTVPGLAVRWDRNGAHVWVVDADKVVHRVGVRIRSRTARTASVEGKLKASDKVVVEGVEGLRDGAKVTVVQGG
jgi:RND family efflux transporter MFP subunit